MTDVVMPRLSDTMEEGTVLRWLKHDGARVERGEELVEIETDKASMTYASDREGTLQTVAREGDTLAVGELIARIGEQTPVQAPDAAGGGATAGSGATAATAGPEATGATTGSAGRAPAPAAAATERGAAATPNGQPAERAEQAPARVRASPLARRLAREAGVELAGLHGSGPGGRIVKADVAAQAGSTRAPAIPAEPVAQAGSTPVAPATPAGSATQAAAAVGQAGKALSPAPTPGEIAAAKGETTAVELTRTQRTIARRMAESRATIPDFTLTIDVDMERCVELRAELGRLASKAADRPATGEGVVPTYNDMIVKACALALREHPRANGSYRDARFELHSRVNVGVAVAVDAGEPTSGALVVPTLFDADAKALGEIARETRALAQRVRDGQITPPELSGATFTVSNLGMYGIRRFSAIVNPPQAAILAVGEVVQRAVVRDGEPVARHTMSVTLACDHRILYGADAALFLARVRELLEEPAALTL
jgi:pyruvate dehydrogenase E2 component (dihydrolipoyllysine-residue acetyltransferase)